ncbi:MAG: metal-dependent hydrolase [Kiloniellales bacterium]|nr:metal-dependent hydrolase [Kiloniellales bacterium]
MFRFAFFLCAGLVVSVLAGPGAAPAAEIQWYGQAAFKITTSGGKVILIDPFITRNPKTPEALKDLAQLGKVDLILVTHGHGDHVGDTVKIAEMTGAKVGMNADLGQSFRTLGIVPNEQLIRFNKSGPIKPLGDGITVTMVRAEHSSEYVFTDPATGKKRVVPGGEPAGYVIELEDGRSLYHAGDTGVFADMAFIGSYYKPDLALLPIGGHFTMDPTHAAYAVKSLLMTRTVVPMHYGTFPPLKGTPEEFKAAIGNEGGVRVIVMQPGDTLDF